MLKELIRPAPKDERPTGEPCPACGTLVRFGSIACPDGRPGCMVNHLDWVCPGCGKNYFQVANPSRARIPMGRSKVSGKVSTMSKLGLFLDRMRQDIAQKKRQFENLGKPHRFPCPYCTKDVEVEYAPDGLSYKLKHKVPGCETYEKPTNRTNGDLLQAFVFHCRPEHRFAPIDNHDVLDKEMNK